MPAGFGYGAVGKAFAKALMSNSTVRNMGRTAGVYAGIGAIGGAIQNDSSLIGGAFRGGLAGATVGLMSGTAKYGAIGGAIAGGLFGESAFSGAVMGAMGGAAYRLGRHGVRTAMRAYRLGAPNWSKGQAAFLGLSAMGRMSSRYIKSTYTRAVNGFNAMKQTVKAGI